MSGSDEPGNADAAAVGDPKPPPENADPKDPGSDDAADVGDPMPPPDNADPSEPGRPDAADAGDPIPPLEEPEELPPGVAGLNGIAPGIVFGKSPLSLPNPAVSPLGRSFLVSPRSPGVVPLPIPTGSALFPPKSLLLSPWSAGVPFPI
jgi:hypothetical protein